MFDTQRRSTAAALMRLATATMRSAKRAAACNDMNRFQSLLNRSMELVDLALEEIQERNEEAQNVPGER
jgi:hypothetical protein